MRACTASNAPVSLEEVLASREARATRQKRALGIGFGAVVSFTVNMPGAIKDTQEARAIFLAGLDALQCIAERKRIGLEFLSELYPATGPEALLCLALTPLEAKELTTMVESAHALGRLFDMDVLDMEGAPVSRRTLGLPPRTCLVCESEAVLCARSRRHSLDEVLAVIQKMVAAYDP